MGWRVLDSGWRDLDNWICVVVGLIGAILEK